MTFAHQTLAAAVFSLVAAGAHAQAQVPSKMYAEFGYAAINLEANSGPNTLKARPGAVTGVIGYQLHPNMAVEGFLGLGLDKDETKLNGAATGVDAKINNTYGLFIKPSTGKE